MIDKNRKTVVVAMSGGVDSSVCAALMKERGYDVIGMMLRLWSVPGKETENRCCTVDAMNQARRIAAQLEIPFYAIDAKEFFRETVVDYFLNGYTQGITPNPCLVCNRHIRWGLLLDRALDAGMDLFATGHYARLREMPGGQIQLLRGVDKQKDQSYFLHLLNQQQLKHTLLPLGDYTKPQVREMAQRFNLPTADRPDSQDLCFLGDETLEAFLLQQAPETDHPGPILNPQGEEIGQHRGLAFYTIGQRRGLGIAAPRPLYVIEKDIENNILIVGYREELGRDHLTAHDVNWIAGQPPEKPIRAEIKIRYKARPVWGLVIPRGESKVEIRFDESLRDITPGQAAVFYDGEICLGGGTIA